MNIKESFVVNLDRDTARLANFLCGWNLTGLGGKLTRVSGTVDESGIIGCIKSHLSVYQRIIESDAAEDDIFCIMEDDCVFTNDAGVKIRACFEEMGSFSIFYPYTPGDGKSYRNKGTLVSSVVGMWATHCYFITKKFARRIKEVVVLNKGQGIDLQLRYLTNNKDNPVHDTFCSNQTYAVQDIKFVSTIDAPIETLRPRQVKSILNGDKYLAALYNSVKDKLPAQLATMPAVNNNALGVMASTRILSFEIGPNCNLNAEHTACPVHITFKMRGAPVDDDVLVNYAMYCYLVESFNGYIAFHFYNEPLLYRGRMFRLMERIKQNVPNAKFLLWSNGLLLPKDVEAANAILAKFDWVVISQYHAEDKVFFKSLKHKHYELKEDMKLDNRLSVNDSPIGGWWKRLKPCYRPRIEMIVDYSGNMPLCCADYAGTVNFGNILDKSFADVIKHWDGVATSSQDMNKDQQHFALAPTVCQKCVVTPGTPRIFRI